MHAEAALYPGPVRVVICQKLALVAWRQLPAYFEIPRHEYEWAPTLDAINLVWDWLAARGRLSELRGAIVALGWLEIVTELDGGARNGVPRDHGTFNSVNFDLEPLRRPLKAARYERSALLLFAIPHHDASVGDKLVDWLEEWYHPISRKQKLSVGALVSTADSVVGAVLRHRQELSRQDVARHIDATRAPVEALTTLADRLGTELGDHAHRLVLLVTVRPGVATPPGMRLLPRPRMARDDIENWALDVLTLANRDVGVPDAWRVWAELICAHAAEEDDALDPRRVFESMDSHIQDLRSDFDFFAATLREASGYA
ncbi:hypothetical protein [Asanoa siamensis]|uniref:Bacterial Death-like domain-containing protein n=1 Tax=Asanoa siamensis TaxID=926357 RepID=A0ABQ4CVA4_9ACTN|nr:hypothetical protein [Asanoa siamensis]GIF75195.1 hypothetical protein Asi02nite_47130 [Asanoa siamensis]